MGSGPPRAEACPLSHSRCVPQVEAALPKAKAAASAFSGTAVPELERQRREQYLAEQRQKLIEQKKAQRERELQQYMSSGQGQVSKPEGTNSAGLDQETMNDARAALRNDLARKFKQDLLQKQAMQRRF